MKQHLIYISLLILTLCSCSGKKTEADVAKVDTIPMMIMQIQKCSKLYTAECYVHKIITHDDEAKLSGQLMMRKFRVSLPVGKRKIAIPMDATLKAYIDFSSFNENNVHKYGKKIEIILPDPRIVITSSRIDHNGVKQFVPLLRSQFSDEEMTAYEKQGRDAIIKSIPELGVIDMAKESAARTLIPMIMQMGYKESDITVTFRKQFNGNDFQTLIDKSTIEK